MGFTDTGLYPGISAAGKSVADRKTTAIADLEFLVKGHSPDLQYPLPPLISRASPAFITRAIASQLKWPILVMNAGPQLFSTRRQLNLTHNWVLTITFNTFFSNLQDVSLKVSSYNAF